MRKYKLLVVVFFFVVIASSIASLLDVNIQSIYRVPILNIRWIDVAVLVIIFSYLIDYVFKKEKLVNTKLIVRLCFVYLFFIIFQLVRSWGVTEVEGQISHFITSISILILIDLSTFRQDHQNIVLFVRKIAILGAIVVIISNFFTLFSFLSGKTIFTDSNIRVGLAVVGKKESVYTEVLIALVYSYGLYSIQHSNKTLEKALFIIAIMGIFVSLVYSFGRGLLFMIFSITVIYLLIYSKKLSHTIIQISFMVILMGMFYLVFGKALKQKGYDPMEKITDIVKFSVDVNNPDWDKGRSVSRLYAVNAWKENIWLGKGYDDLSNHGLPPDTATAHNFVITSLFHFGLVGTSIYLFILVLLYRNSYKLFQLLRNGNSYENDVMKLLIISSFFWIILFLTQEAFWEKHSLTIQFMLLGLISNYYKQAIA